MKKGFGLLEVLIASVVLGFLIVGLTKLQTGNRESILRVRARDAASIIAQEVIDSVSALGSASVEIGTRECGNNGANDLCRLRVFKGAAGDVTTNYKVKVAVTKDQSQEVGNTNTSDYIAAGFLSVARPFAKRLEVTVNWDFKKSTQSINMSTVIQ